MSESLIKFEEASNLPEEYVEKFAEDAKANTEGVEPRLPKLQMPTGKGKQFSLDVQGQDEDEQYSEIIGVILFQTPSNAWWSEPFGGGTSVIPDCASHDGIKPSDQYPDLQSETCAGCRHNRFGSARDPEGNKAPGKACRNVKRVVILRADDPTIPVLLTVPPASLRSFDDYMIKLRKENRPYWTVASKLTIKTDSNRAGIDYPIATFNVAGYINDKAALDELQKSKADWVDLIKSTLFATDDVTPNPTENTSADPEVTSATKTPEF